MRCRLASIAVAALAAFAAAGSAGAAEESRPNIDHIDVRVAPGGVVQFEIVYVDPVALPPSTVIDLFLDADDDVSTGEEGFEHAIDWSGGELGDAYVSLFEGDGVIGRRPPGLEFEHDGRSSTFTVPVVELGFPEGFDYSFAFYAYIEVDGEFVDAAPTHVLISTSADPFHVDGEELLTGKTATFDDPADSTPAEGSYGGLLVVIGVVLGLGGAIALAGWAFERLRQRRTGRGSDARGGI